MEIKDLGAMDKSKKKAFFWCLCLVTAADGVMTDDEISLVVATGINVLKLGKKELENIATSDFSLEQALLYAQALNECSTEELTMLGIMMGTVAKIDGSFDKSEKKMIKDLLTSSGLSTQVVNAIIKSLSDSK
jgi:uncharacterized tellurite resistance protein B-like protein